MEKILKVFKDLEELTGEGSQAKKQYLIVENFHEENFSYFLDVCFNPFVTTKLHKLDISESPISGDFSDLVPLIEELKKSPAANNQLRERANALVNTRVSEGEEDLELRKILMKILTKRMNIGIGAKIINKALKKQFIPDPSLMLATDDQDSLLDWETVYCEEKYDGVRVAAIYEDGNFSYVTRAFNQLDPLKLHKITFCLKQIMNNSGLKGNWFFDGELTDKNRKSVSGKVTQILKGTAPDNIGDGIIFNVFDLDDLDSIKNGVGVLPYSIRRQSLEAVTELLTSEDPVQLAKMWKLDSAEGIAAIYKEIVDAGGEGVICKRDDVYECKRSKSWIKFKEVNECDLKITGWYPGEGKREGFIGGFFCTDLSETMKVKIGSGFTDNDLEELSSDPDSLIGKIISVQYNVTITDKHENRSLFLPRFVEVRHDKSEADDLSSKF